MYKRKKLGIVILNYNDAEVTATLCNLISCYQIIDKIVIVDNLSSDSSFEKLANLKNDKIDIIQTKRNGGYSYGNNFGAFYLIEMYQIDYIFIANPDVSFEEDFIRNSTDCLIKGNIQAISGIMLDKNGKKVEFIGKINSYIEDLLECTLLVKRIIKKYNIRKFEEKNNLILCEILPGSLFGISSNVFIEIGGLDENVFLYCEERILGTKLKNLDYKLAINKNISFYHLHSVSINKSLTKIKQLKQFYKSCLYYNKTYRNIGIIKILIMKIFMAYGLLARKILFKIFY